MAKQTSSKKPVVEAEPIVVDSTPVEAPVEAKKAPIERPIKKEVSKITITLKNGTSRTYSQYTHGNNWEVLANNYATSTANDGCVVEKA